MIKKKILVRTTTHNSGFWLFIVLHLFEKKIESLQFFM